MTEPFHRLVKIMPSGCWEWAGTRTKEGYGKVKIKARSRAPLRAHRIAYEAANGPIPDGMIVCHSCDNPPCCNPDHLWLGTHTDNMRDAASKARFPTQQNAQCAKGHTYAETGSYARPGSRRRNCRACALEASAAQYQRIKSNRGSERANNAPDRK